MSSPTHIDEETPLVRSPPTDEPRGFFIHVKRHGRRGCGFWFILAILVTITVLILKYSTNVLVVSPHNPDGTHCESERNYVVALILSGVFGTLGIDRFYLGYVLLGILKLVTGGGFGIWWVIDFILIAVNAIPDSNGCLLNL
ncbi:hypothetical protein BC829DRAFT_232883 [Chytridium lagenaria]|nr:hypothetical protein BC829DRAFT_232883 [Chytridium lagenaria]